MQRAVLLLSFTLSLLPFNAAAWNSSGHMIVSELAWRRLSSTERNRISTLLQQHPHYAELLNTNIPANVEGKEWIFLKASTWPDMVRPGPNKPPHIVAHHRGEWHYINMPFVASPHLGSVQPTPPKLTNAVERLVLKEAELRSTAVPASDRAVALCWYLHIMGDLHQPLHAVSWFSPVFSDPDGDRGGNEVAIQPQTAPQRLHTFWDDLLGSGQTYTFIDLVADDITRTWPSSKLQKEWRRKTYLEWAQESKDAAIAFAYLDGQVPHAKWRNNITAADVPDLATGYEANAQMIARRRAAAAGVRLAKKLKDIF